MIKTLHHCDAGEFDKEVNALLSEGYKVSSTGTCAAINSVEYDFCPSFTAILIREVCDE